MTLIYHGTPITPAEVLLTVAGKAFCLCYYNRSKFRLSVMEGISSQTLFDVGTYPAWQAGEELDAEYIRGYFDWLDPLLDRPTSRAIIPDPIGVGAQVLDAHIREWPFGDRGWPVYHLDAHFMQPVDRMLRLLDEWPHVAIGWAEKDLPILGDDHRRCLNTLWNAIERRHGRRTPAVHHFRGTQLVTHGWPFASLDSTDVGRNHNRPQNTARQMADRWDAAQCPPTWTPCAEQERLFA